MSKTTPSIIELPKSNNCKKKYKKINYKKNKQNDGTYTPSNRYINKEIINDDGINTPPIRHINKNKNNIILKITFGKNPFSIIFDKKN